MTRALIVVLSALVMATGGFMLGTWYGVAQPVPWGLYP